jgi:lysozyme
LKNNIKGNRKFKLFKNVVQSFLVLLLILFLAIVLIKYRWIIIEQYYLFTSKSFKKYTQLGVPIPTQYSIHGIDVSRYQGVINWKMVNQMNDNGIKIQFAFIKATQGIDYRDPLFSYNWKNSGKYDIARAPYHYFLPCEDGIKQANNFLSVINKNDIDMPPVIDVEELKNCDEEKMHKNLKACLQQVFKKCGKNPIIYSGKDFYIKYLNTKYNKNKKWIAHYYVPEIKNIKAWTFWQYSDKATVSGINVPVDINAFSGNKDEFELFLNNN